MTFIGARLGRRSGSQHSDVENKKRKKLMVNLVCPQSEMQKTCMKFETSLKSPLLDDTCNDAELIQNHSDRIYDI